MPPSSLRHQHNRVEKKSPVVLLLEADECERTSDPFSHIQAAYPTVSRIRWRRSKTARTVEYFEHSYKGMQVRDLKTLAAAADVAIIADSNAITQFVLAHENKPLRLVVPLKAPKFMHTYAIAADFTSHTAMLSAVCKALSITQEEAERRGRLLFRFLSQPPQPNAKLLDTDSIVKAYRASCQRLLLFDYDGTLSPIVNNPNDALPSKPLLDHLTALSKNPANTVWIISGRDASFLDTHFGHISRLGLSAEHGSFMKMDGKWSDILSKTDKSWKDQCLGIFNHYAQKTPGSVVEPKQASVTWHFRNATFKNDAEEQSEKCHQDLLRIPGIDILVGKMNLEARSSRVNKGEVVKRIKANEPNADFCLCAGDDQTDEDMFRALQHDQNAHTIHVGPSSKPTFATLRLDTSEDVVDLLCNLASVTFETSLM